MVSIDMSYIGCETTAVHSWICCLVSLVCSFFCFSEFVFCLIHPRFSTLETTLQEERERLSDDSETANQPLQSGKQLFLVVVIYTTTLLLHLA